MKDATLPQLDFLATELPRFEACGAWERAYNTRYVSRMFLVSKPGVNLRQTIATRHGQLFPPFVRNYSNRRQLLPSSHRTSPTNRGSRTYTAWPPRPSTTPPRETYSSPVGTARARGSDDQDGALWLFDCHAGLDAHPQRRNRTHTTDGKLLSHGPTHYG
jgi:hypothetical protein